MATSHVYLSGGPCNGRTVSTSQIKGGLVGYVLCQGHYYEANGKTRRNGDAIFADTGTTAPQPPSPVSPDATAPHSVKAWGDLRKQVNSSLPAATRKIERLNAGALSALRHRRRVKR